MSNAKPHNRAEHDPSADVLDEADAHHKLGRLRVSVTDLEELADLASDLNDQAVMDKAWS